MWDRTKELFGSMLLGELLQGLKHPGRNLFARKIPVMFP